jgi:hypothetical protein
VGAKMISKERNTSEKITPEQAYLDSLDAGENSSDAEEETGNQDNFNSNLEADETQEFTSEYVVTQDNIENNKIGRSNSEVVDDNGTPSPIKYSERNVTEKCDGQKNVMKDAIVISVISLEAGAKYYAQYHEQLENDKLHNHVKKGPLSKAIILRFKKNVNYTSAKTYADAFSEILKNKEPAHCIAVLEGARENFPDAFVR